MTDEVKRQLWRDFWAEIELRRQQAEKTTARYAADMLRVHLRESRRHIRYGQDKTDQSDQ